MQVSRFCQISTVVLAILWVSIPARAQAITNLPQHVIASEGSSTAASEGSSGAQAKVQWHYGGFADFGYLLDFNHPANEIFRSRGTTWHVDDPHLNMAAASISRDVSEQSRWGTQLTIQAGKDTQVFGLSATAPNLP